MGPATRAAILIAAVACVSCGGTAGVDERPAQPRPPELSRKEIAWIGKLDRWYAFESAYGTLRDCSETFRRKVGRPPGPRLAPLAALTERACRLFRNANVLESRAFATNDADAFARASRAFRRAEQLIERVRARLDAFRGSTTRRLPRVGGATATRSRIEPRLSRVGSRRVGRAVEIRCCSERYWRRLASGYSGFAAEEM